MRNPCISDNAGAAMLRAAEKLRISEMEVSRTTKMPLVCYFLRSVQAHEVAT
jgi:hypothetical protein